ncbi:hypothetical protein D3C72_1248700 [compost metagenome]
MEDGTYKLDKQQGVTLLRKKSKAMEELRSLTKQFLETMPLTSNVVGLPKGWCAIRYFDGQLNMQLAIEHIAGDVDLLRRNGREENELTESVLNSLLPGLQNGEDLEDIEEELYNRARVELWKLTEPEHQPEEAEDGPSESEEYSKSRPPGITNHAGQRYAQRRMGIPSEQRALEHFKANSGRIVSLILQEFASAVLLWTDPEDGTEYLMDDNNTMFVYAPKDNTIVTLFESDFGFAKHINRQIVLDQIREISKAYDDYLCCAQGHMDVQDMCQQQIQDVDNEIAALKAQIDVLKSKKAVVTGELDESNKVVKATRARYDAECGKVFKKFNATMR